MIKTFICSLFIWFLSSDVKPELKKAFYVESLDRMLWR